MGKSARIIERAFDGEWTRKLGRAICIGSTNRNVRDLHAGCAKIDDRADHIVSTERQKRAMINKRA